ncbi:ABC transporter permease subunit [Macrococcoides caseolyticum]|uniref:ABC transporter permease subunit n=1 Tax=Macrococcoides caseolyticum TaxID=69966 RepID=UPI001F3F902E|nr:ABC transporter permease subunit [Macrococcus caseolyticus]MCE4956198.1 ABC transporter permease [Macrococcus caseolyticus]
MFNLVINEFNKYFNRLATYIMLGIIIAFMILGTILNMQFGSKEDNKTYGDNWKTEVKSDILQYQKRLSEIAKKQEDKKSIVEITDEMTLGERISELQFYLKKEVKPPAINNYYQKLIDTGGFASLVAIMLIVLCSSLMSREHQQGTIKLLLIRPASRMKIFFSKFIFLLISSFIFLLFTYLVSAVINIFTSHMNSSTQLAVQGKKGYEMVQVFELLAQQFFANFIFVLTFAIVAYALSVIFKNTALSLGVTFALMFFGDLIIMFMQGKTKLLEWLWPVNWDLSKYLANNPAKLVDKDLSFGFSLAYDVIILIVIISIAAWLFNKRDVAN